jgi:hypothetical protein
MLDLSVNEDFLEEFGPRLQNAIANVKDFFWQHRWVEKVYFCRVFGSLLYATDAIISNLRTLVNLLQRSTKQFLLLLGLFCQFCWTATTANLKSFSKFCSLLHGQCFFFKYFIHKNLQTIQLSTHEFHVFNNLAALDTGFQSTSQSLTVRCFQESFWINFLKHKPTVNHQTKL